MRNQRATNPLASHELSRDTGGWEMVALSDELRGTRFILAALDGSEVAILGRLHRSHGLRLPDFNGGQLPRDARLAGMGTDVGRVAMLQSWCGPEQSESK